MGHEPKRVTSDFLFSTGDFVVGIGSVFNVFGNYFAFNYSKTPQDADRRALSTDGELVKRDFGTAVGRTKHGQVISARKNRR